MTRQKRIFKMMIYLLTSSFPFKSTIRRSLLANALQTKRNGAISPFVSRRMVIDATCRAFIPKYESKFKFHKQWMQSIHLQSNQSLESNPLNEPQNDNKFIVTAPYQPTADQPDAISKIVENVQKGDRYNILRGCTGTGKTMVMAHCIARIGKPTLILCHNKTLAAQLAREMKAYFKHNHVQLFVSYYNYYTPESYSETSGKYNSKKSSINDELDALRHMATRALVQHKDVVVISSVSCIYGLGMPKSYLDSSFTWSIYHEDKDNIIVPDIGNSQFRDLKDAIQTLENNMYQPNTLDDNDDNIYLDANNNIHDLARGQYELIKHHPKKASITLWPPSEQYPLRLDFQLIEKISTGNTDHDPIWAITNIAVGNNKGMKQVSSITIFPAKHHSSNKAQKDRFDEAIRRIENECTDYSNYLRNHQNKHVEADRLQQRVTQDLILIKETGTCPGIENYSRHFNLREQGDPPDTLLDYFGISNDQNKDWLLIMDESHVTLPQLKAMYGGDRARKTKLIKHGYRLPSALDNRPLTYDEFWDRIPQSIFVSATPSQTEMTLSESSPVDMMIRPTYVCDPVIDIRNTKNQLDDLLHEINDRSKRNERTLALTLTKKDAEDLSKYFIKHGVSSDYIHSGLNTHERSNALKALQTGSIDCLVGVNVLREGLDLPQVSLVAILNADVEGFLRSETALLQMIGRAARNKNGKAIMYADRITSSMKKCIDATKERRKVQLAYNAQNRKNIQTTKGSSIQSIFEILKDQIEAEQQQSPLDDKPIIETSVSSFDQSSINAVSLMKNSGHPKNQTIVTDHIPSKPGVYFWKNQDDLILYIGKAKRLRSRVKSYLSPNAKHSLRIKTMLKKATKVEFVLTPSDRDALILESNLIKHHQPPYNVLLKDDESYPYICASIGETLPSFSIVPRKQEGGGKVSHYKYFGPYPHYNELNKIIQMIEEKYDLRSKSFQVRFGNVSQMEYQQTFQKALDEVFLSPKSNTIEDISTLRLKYEEGSNLFDSTYNKSRDVVAIGRINNDEAVIHLVQLRDGLVAGQFSYTCQISSGIDSSEDLGTIIQTVLERKHYCRGEALLHRPFSFFPSELLVQYPLTQTQTLREVFRTACKEAEPNRKIKPLTIRKPVKSGQRKDTDSRAMQFAIDNAEEVAKQKSYTSNTNGATKSSVDGTAMKELTDLLSLEKVPSRIECYDISHTRGDETVGSRVVFIAGQPKKDLYRVFNVKSVEGIDDYASLEEVLERRFRKAWVNGAGGLVDEDDPWSIPDLVVIDGGKGQLTAALKGMAKASIFASNCEPEYDTNSSNDEMQQSFRSNKRSAKVPVVSLAKNMEHVYAPHVMNPINDSPDSAALLLLRSLRDESHRFALAAHRRKRSHANGFNS